MSAPSFTSYVMKRPWLKRWMMPLANWYADAAGYRKLGLRYLTLMDMLEYYNGVVHPWADDLIPEESETVLLALKRLPPKEAYDRVFRLRRAFQCSLSHQLLPKDQQTKPQEDYAYLSPIIKEIEAESRERNDLEAMVVNKRKKAGKSAEQGPGHH